MRKLFQEEFQKRFDEYTEGKVVLYSPYINKRTKISVQCNKCGYIWDIAPTSILYNKDKGYKFSGCPECRYATYECEYCHKKFKRLISAANTINFCSKECGNKYKNLLSIDTQNGVAYRRNAFLHYEHKCAICGWNKDERVLEVHHIDENRDNNNIDNLIILCPTCHKFLTLHLYTLEELKSIY